MSGIAREDRRIAARRFREREKSFSRAGTDGSEQVADAEARTPFTQKRDLDEPVEVFGKAERAPGAHMVAIVIRAVASADGPHGPGAEVTGRSASPAR
jgi:hypothetical protein